MARWLNGTTDYLTSAAFPSLGTDYTAVAWCRPQSLVQRTVVSLRSTSAGNPIAFQLQVLASGAVNGAVRDDAGSSAFPSSTNTTPAGVWALAMVGRSGNAAHAQLNDGPRATATASGGTFGAITPNSLNVGALVTGTTARSSFFPGDIAWLAIYSALLSQAEVAAIYSGASPLLVRPASLVRLWPLRGLACDRPERDAVAAATLDAVGTAWAPDPPAAGPAPLFGPQDGLPWYAGAFRAEPAAFAAAGLASPAWLGASLAASAWSASGLAAALGVGAQAGRRGPTQFASTAAASGARPTTGLASTATIARPVS